MKPFQWSGVGRWEPQTLNDASQSKPLAVSLSFSICPPAASICCVTRPCLSFWWRTSARFVVNRLVQPSVVQMNVVSVTDVHDVAFCCDAPWGLVATGKATPGEECSRDTELWCSGFEELKTGECAATCTNERIMNDSRKM